MLLIVNIKYVTRGYQLLYHVSCLNFMFTRHLYYMIKKSMRQFWA